MEPSELERAVEAAKSVASALGLRVQDAVVVRNSNRIAVRLTPCDVLARVAPLSLQRSAEFEVEVVRHLAETECGIAELEPRVEPRIYERDGFLITLWTYYEPLEPSPIAPGEYAQALARLHAGMRRVEVRAPHFTDRVAAAERLVADPTETPELRADDRQLLSNTLSRLGTAIRAATGDQLLHGEPHLGNVLRAATGLLFIDLETCCRGGVEFDIAHGLLPGEDGTRLSAEEVCEHYPGANPGLIEPCRTLIWAIITTWRWQRDDQLANRNYWRVEGLNQLRGALDAAAPAHRWCQPQ
jgi:hypothetical protein